MYVILDNQYSGHVFSTIEAVKDWVYTNPDKVNVVNLSVYRLYGVFSLDLKMCLEKTDA